MTYHLRPWLARAPLIFAVIQARNVGEWTELDGVKRDLPPERIGLEAG